MNIIFDKNNPRLIVKDYPIETTKIELNIPAYQNTVQTGNSLIIELGNFSAILTGTAKAIKDETVISTRPVFNEQGEQVDTEEYAEIVSTVLESQPFNLTLL